jgi:hypothetical protein
MPYWNFTTWGGSRQDLPLLRGQNYTLAYRSGQMWRQKYFDQRTISAAFWAVGVNQSTGLPSSSQSLDFTTNFYNLRSMLAQQGVGGSQLGSLTRRWYEYVNGTPTLITATAMAELAGNMAVTMSGRSRGDFTVDWLLADPFFYGPPVPAVAMYLNNLLTVTNQGDAVIGYGQSQYSGGTTFQITLHGPLTSPTVTNLTAGVSVTVNATIPTGITLTLDVLNYTAYDNTSTSWLGYVSHAGARPWFLLVPGAQICALSSTNAGDTGHAAAFGYSPGFL